MLKFSALLLGSTLLLTLAGCQEASSETDAEGVEQLTGSAEGFGGVLEVEVTRNGEDITGVTITEHSETDGYGTKAIDELPSLIVEEDSTDVEAVSGATITSDALIEAVNNALDPETFPAEAAEEEVTAEEEMTSVSQLSRGLGVVYNGRVGPGQDNTETPVYSYNIVLASTLFDEEDRIADLHVDIVEVATPNYDGEGMPHFSGFPGQGGYNNDENHDGEIDGTTEDSDDYFLSEVESWQTKRDRGNSYVFSATGTWSEQMDAYEDFFIGMTVAEVEEWFEMYTSDENGRPLTADMEEETDQAKYSNLTEENQEMLSDVTTGATMSLNDSHGNIVGAIRASYENRESLAITLD